MKSKSLSKSRRLSEDIISTLPSSIIETILCLVPIKDAVRTSILSKNWKYNWTKIPKLVFREWDMFDRSTTGQLYSRPQLCFNLLPNERLRLTRTCKVFYAIYQVLLLHQGPIIEFSLSMWADNTNVEIDQIIRHLSRHNTLKKFSLKFSYAGCHINRYFIPLSIFTLPQLTELYLYACILALEPTFIGCRNLTSLNLEYVTISSKALLLLLSGCPLLKSFTMILDYEEDNYDKNVTIVDIFKCLPMIEHLAISRETIQFFDKVEVPRDLQIALVHLKYLSIEKMTFPDEFQLYFLALMLRSCPNLEKIKLTLFDYLAYAELNSETDDDSVEENAVTWENCSDVWFEHLIELEIDDFIDLEPDLGFVKLILAKSPMLKKVSLVLDERVTNDEELEMLRILIRSPRASPVAELIVERKTK